MEKFTKANTIQVKSELATLVLNIATVDTLLSLVELHQIEDTSTENNSCMLFKVNFKDETSSTCSIAELQEYVDAICGQISGNTKMDKADNMGKVICPAVSGEDSSYDSDYEGSEENNHLHDDISRTVSDTLDQEFSEYVSSQQKYQLSDFVYQTKLEFALKLGYTEKLVQAALQKLGPNPEQNELLAELIKLGAHQHSSLKLRNDLNGCDNADDFVEMGCIGSNDKSKPRPIVIDGSNVAMSHGNKEVFSCRGIKICVDWFRNRGHSEITVFVPKWRKETPHLENFIIDQEILYELERDRLLVFTPSREIGGKRMVCYDDRYILKLAADNEGIVVSNDNYRDLIQECPEFRKVIEARILMYSFVNDRFMPPDDPLGRSGPTLDGFLKLPTFRKTETCPYGKKCTYGNKCKYNHPERGLGPQKSVTEKLVENAQKQLLARNIDPAPSKIVKEKSLSLPVQSCSSYEGQSINNLAANFRKQALSRTKSTTFDMTKNLCNNSYNLSDCMSGTYALNSHVQPIHKHMLYQRTGLSLNQAIDIDIPAFGNFQAKKNNSSAGNLHRKLERELSINPTFDPRIQQIQNNFASSADSSHHISVTEHYSFQDQDYLDSHQNLMRISSAPPASRSLFTSNELAYTSPSEPELCARVSPAYNPVSSVTSLWSVQPIWSNPCNCPVSFVNVEETRRKLHFHLASIFPEEQVDVAMNYYPNETNPQTICAAILSLLSTKS